MHKRHAGFLLALAVGTLAGGVALALPFSPAARALVALDTFFAVYLVAMIGTARSATADDLLRHAATRDEGLPLILLLGLATVIASLTAILMVLRSPTGWLEAGLALGAVPAGLGRDPHPAGTALRAQLLRA